MGNWFQEHRQDWQQVTGLLQFAKPHKIALFIAGVLVFANVGLELLRPYLLKYAVSDIFLPQRTELLNPVVGVYGLTVVLSMVAMYLQNYILQSTGQEIIYRIRSLIFERIVLTDNQLLRKVKTGSLVTKVTNDTDAICSLFVEIAVPMAGDFLMMLGILVLMFWINTQLAWTSLAIILCMSIAIHYFQQYGRLVYRRVRTCISDSNSFIQEAMSGMSIVKSYNAALVTLQEYQEINGRHLAAGLREVRTFAIFRPIVDFLYFICVILILKVTDISTEITDAAVVFVFLQYIEKFFVPVRGIAERYNLLQSALAAADRVGAVWQEADGAVVDTRPDFCEEFRSLTFEHVWFRYEDGQEWILKDVSVEVKRGEMVALVGPSGAGKTSLVSLAMRWHSPQQGRVLLNGKPIENYSLTSTRRLLGHVFQNQHLFKGSILDNITLHNEKIDLASVEAALRNVQLWDKIQAMPAKLATEAGYLGSRLSMGERQLLSMARVLARQYPVMILDEATSSMDSETEEQIRYSMDRIRGSHTLLIIAHRLATIRSADRIYVLEAGRIVQCGDYATLVQEEGLFRNLWEARN